MARKRFDRQEIRCETLGIALNLKVKTRRSFLTTLFQLLEQNAVPYCVLRNYEDIYEDASSDVDVAVDREHLKSFRDCLDAAAAAIGYLLIHQTRYTNYSFVYHYPGGPFVRVDVELEIRWRVFPILSTGEVIGSRRKHGAFYVPDPTHESVIVFVAAIWRRCLRPRYRERLAALTGEVRDVKELGRVFRVCFGFAGPGLATTQLKIQAVSARTALWCRLKRSIILNSFCRPANWHRVFSYVIEDLQRYCHRLKNPPGISVLYVSGGEGPDETGDLFKRVEFLYPMQKLVKHSFRVAPYHRHAARLTFKLRLQRLYTLFKGGVFMRYYQVANDSDIPRVTAAISRYLYPSRAFSFAQSSEGAFWMGHAKTGLATQCCPASGAADPHGEFIRFIARILMRDSAGAARCDTTGDLVEAEDNTQRSLECKFRVES